MIVLSLDPGNIESAFILWDGDKEIMLNKDKIPNIELKSKLFELTKQVEIVLIEYISSYHMPVGQSIFDVACWCGIFKEICESYDVKVKFVFRPSIKMHHAHALRKVNDAVINSILREKYGEDNTIKKPNKVYWNVFVEKAKGNKYMSGDLWAAFALATYWTEPSESKLKNDKEREENKLTPNLL